MKWPKWLDDFPYEASPPGDKTGKRWLFGSACVLVAAALGILAVLIDRMDYLAMVLSNGRQVRLVACYALLILVDLFRLGCYAAWRKGKEVHRVYPLGQAVGFALLLAAMVWLFGSFWKGEEPPPPVSHSYDYQSSPLAAFAWGDGEGYQYHIVDVKAPLVYDLCLDMYFQDRVTLYSGWWDEWSPWPAVLGADALYERMEGRDWLALWEDRIVWVSFDMAPEDDGGTVIKTLETLRAWEG